MSRHATSQRCTLAGFSFALLQFCLLTSGDAFLSPLPQRSLLVARNNPIITRLFALPDIQDMRIAEMRSELESYGVSTRPFLEKSEFVNALEKARAEGLKPKTDNNAQAKNAEPPNTNGSSQKNSNTQQAPSSSSTNTSSRADRLKEEMEKAKTMRVSELKEKLKSMGVNTKSFFEKTEFVRAYAEAVVDGVNSNNNKAGAASSDEPYDPEYRDVVVQKFDPQSQQRYMLSGTIIDIKLS